MSHSVLYNKLINCKRWRDTRRIALEREPLCESCKKFGRYRAAQCVHHITPVESATNETLAENLCYDLNNLQSLCFKCHAEIHKADGYNSRSNHKIRQKEKVERWLQALNIPKK